MPTEQEIVEAAEQYGHCVRRQKLHEATRNIILAFGGDVARYDRLTLQPHLRELHDAQERFRALVAPVLEDV